MKPLIQPLNPRRSSSGVSAHIPSEMYGTVLHAVAVTPSEQRFCSITRLIVDQVIKHLAPCSLTGLKLLVLRGLRREQRVVCFYTVFGRRSENLHIASLTSLEFHGAESLAGYAAQRRHAFVCQDTHHNPEHLPIRQERQVESIAVFPLLQEGRVAGCFQVCSSQPHYFSPRRIRILSNYANLLAHAFATHEFYDVEQMALYAMPDHQVQQSRIDTFRQRVQALLQVSATQQSPLDLLRAEDQVLQDLAQELSEQ